MRFILIFFLFPTFHLLAQEPDSSYLIYDSINHRFDDVLVKASRHAVLIKNIPGSVQVLNKESIQASELMGLADILNQVPGVYMQSGGFQTSRLTIRGIGSRNPYGSGRIRAFYEDIPMSAGDGTTIIEDLEPYFIGNAEVTKGPNSAWYGSGLGGSIRFFAPENELNKNHFRVFSGLSSYANLKTGALVGLGGLKNNLNLGISRNSGDGYRENSEFYKNSFLLSGNLGRKNRLSYIFLGSDVRSEIASSLDEKTYLKNPEKAAANWNRVKGYKKYKRFLGGLRLQTQFSEIFTNTLSVSGNIIDPFELRPFNILDDQSKSFQLLEQIQIKFENHLFLVGMERLHENYHWRILQNNTEILSLESKELRDQWNGFVSWEWDVFQGFHLALSANLNQTQYQIIDLFDKDGVDYSGKTNEKYIVSPRLGINYALNPDINLYASMGHGFSNPTVEESLNSQGFINKELKPEQGLGFDAGIRSYFFQRNVWIDFTLYQIELNDLLVTKRVSEEVFSGENAGSARIRGWELLSQVQLFTHLKSNISYQQSFHTFGKFMSDGVDYSGKHLPGIPSFQIKAELEYLILKYFKLGSNLTLNGKQYLSDNNYQTSTSWQTLDFKITFEKKFHYGNLLVQTGARNVFNEQYPSMVLINAPSFGGNSPRYYYPGMPRNYYLAIEVKF